MHSRKELRQAYKNRAKPAGIFQIKNRSNGMIFLGSSLNIEGSLNKHRFMLSLGGHRNQRLQQDWNRDGEENFVFEILQIISTDDLSSQLLKKELQLLEDLWVEEYNVPGEKVYNKDRRIREA